MKIIQAFAAYYIKLIGIFSTQKAAEITFEVFQRVKPRKMFADEIDFYKSNEPTIIPCQIEPISVYTKGSKNGEVIFMLHGWNSNLGRLSQFTEILVEQGYYCVLFDLPGNGKSRLRKTNIKIMSQVFETVIQHINPTKPFSVLAHSFGTMVTSYTLARHSYQINQLFFMTSLNQFEPFFKELKTKLKLNDNILKQVIEMGQDLLEEPVQEIVVKNKLKQLNFKELVVFHDKYDKILPYSYSELLVEAIPNSKLYSYENIGHSKMLQNRELLTDFEKTLTKKAP